MAAMGNYEVVELDLGSLTPGSYVQSISAPSGKVVLGGGVIAYSGSLATNESFPNASGTEWTVKFVTNSGASVKLRATCAEMAV